MNSEITTILNSISKNWACTLLDGSVYKTTVNDNTLGTVLKIQKVIVNDLEVGDVILIKSAVIFRPAFGFFIFIFEENIKKDVAKEVFIKIVNNCYFEISEAASLDDTKKKLEIDLVLFSMALEIGPEPIAFLPLDYDDQYIFKICMKSMLLLSVESEGAKQDMISFNPYNDLDSLMVVYLFHIPDEKARGGAYDASLTFLINYNKRALVFENAVQIERELLDAKKRILKEYYSKKELKAEPGYSNILIDLQKELSKITLKSTEFAEITSLKREMLEAVQKLKNL